MSDTPASRESTRLTFWKKLGGGALSISLVFHIILIVLGAFWVWHIIPPEPEKIVDFTQRAGGGGGTPVQKASQEKRTANLAKSSAARVSAVNVTSSFTLPDPGMDSGLTSLSSLGASSLSGGLGGLGSGMGTGMGFGNGTGGGMPGAASVRFFDQEVRAQRIAYVIDYSKSMRGKRETLMRAELSKSVSKLHPTQEYQLIFFAGPAWVAGWDIQMEPGDREGSVTSDAGVTQHWKSINAGNWERSGKKQQAPWLEANKSNIRKSVSIVQESGLVYGTFWKPALDLALEMTPPPDIIYFMTDGVVSNKVYETIDDIARTARRRKTVVNTIAMMEPAAADAMATLANKTGGKFTLIREDGTASIAKSGN